jgi:hypothetical protein
MENVSTNPLAKHFRQPKLFVKLPSNGAYYPDGTFEPNENMEFPVYPMTAKDEILFKTPDALLNGQSIVGVIENCVPNIKSGWMVPSIDVDAILIAIRIATYGDTMDLEFKIPNTNEERAFEIKLTPLLDTLTGQTYDAVVEYENMTFELAPGNYKTFTDQSLKTFEEQRLFATINNEKLEDTEKLRIFNESFGRLTDININSIFSQVKSITIAGEDTVVNPNHIREFLENASTQVYKTLLDHIDFQRQKFQIKPFEITTTEEDRENGAPESFKVPFTFDQANFFG